MMRGSTGSGFDCGVGTRTGNPVGTFGVITMNMMISTNSTSINGTMFGSETGPRLPPPTAIPMIRSPYRVRRHANPSSTAEVTVVHLCWPDFLTPLAMGLCLKDDNRKVTGRASGKFPLPRQIRSWQAAKGGPPASNQDDTALTIKSVAYGEDYQMHDRRFVALLALVFSWPAIASAQIITLENVGDKTVACSRSGLTSSFKDCGVRADWYTYVFVGVISGITPVENDEKQIQLVPEEVFLGTPATTLTVLTSQADCMREFKVGDRWLFYLRKVEGEPIVLDYYGNDSLPVADAQNQIGTLRRLEKIGNVAILRGQVVRGELFSGDAVPNAQITATRQPDGRQSFCVTDPDGRYEFPPLTPGKYKITVQPVASYQPDDSEVHLTSGTCRDI